ncbi:hypothetical protein BX666DRAFT_1820927, partial [Dichotomocladium elegans]
KKGFIKAELIRYVRNSSTVEAFETMVRKFFFRLRQRGYPPRLLLYIFSQVRYADRQKYLESSVSLRDNQILPFVTDFNPVWE